MKEFARTLLPTAILAGLCCGAAIAADLSTVGQWANKYPFDNIARGKSLWDQPGVQAAMRAAMGQRFFALSQTPHALPLFSDGRGKKAYAALTGRTHPF